ncbi:TIGR01440 family protein [Geomicrobium sp. JSM 1781026]|uniref:TIGR01440 family protein n=1 Tax=Geomicrobium sp. JSM 1781026 TaxID=3344580 RepID=UPI0035BF3CC5
MHIRADLKTMLEELQAAAQLRPGHILVIGASTSEVAGKQIGSSGSFEIAADLFAEIEAFCEKYQLYPAYQGCEHINRALVVPKALNMEEVNVTPVRTAGGALASLAFSQGGERVMVEHVKADAGIDIGLTLFGMHLKHVAVPVRPSIHKLGEAIVTMARTRPKYIGGPRSSYDHS